MSRMWGSVQIVRVQGCKYGSVSLEIGTFKPRERLDTKCEITKDKNMEVDTIPDEELEEDEEI